MGIPADTVFKIAGFAVQTPFRCDVDNDALAQGRHYLYRRAARKEQCVNVHRHDVAPLLIGGAAGGSDVVNYLLTGLRPRSCDHDRIKWNHSKNRYLVVSRGRGHFRLIVVSIRSRPVTFLFRIPIQRLQGLECG
jgi:hypothetical protein